jgi:serine/threonine protein phosphatase 1
MRLLAIGDIHGCLRQFDHLLNVVQPTRGDSLILLGDYVDRGPDSRGVIDRVLELRRSGPHLVCLRGNHEIMMVMAREGTGDRKMWLAVGGQQALESYGRSPGRTGALSDVPESHWRFLIDGLEDYFETERHIFVHAGVHRDLLMPEQPDYMLFWEPLMDDMVHCSGKTVICGHTAQKSGEIKVIPGAICIDTFAHGGGWLTCLDARSGSYWQVNSECEMREGRIDPEA